MSGVDYKPGCKVEWYLDSGLGYSPQPYADDRERERERYIYIYIYIYVRSKPYARIDTSDVWALHLGVLIYCKILPAGSYRSIISIQETGNQGRMLRTLDLGAAMST